MRRGIIKYFTLAVLTCGFSANAFAVAAGFYMGIETGLSSNNARPQIVTVPIMPPPMPGILPVNTSVLANPRSNQWGTRIFFGNKLNQYFGIEGGLSLFSNINYKPVTASGSPISEARVKAFDIGFLGSFAFKSIEVFGKGGAAATYLSTSGGFNANGKSTYKTSLRPMISIGASYSFNQNWVGQVSFIRYMVGSFINYVDLMAVGFSYHFVDIYCGQFLCDD